MREDDQNRFFCLAEVRDVLVAYQRGIVSSRIESSILQGTYERPEGILVSEAVQLGDRVVDIGAGLGFTSVLAAMKGASRIYSFEPNPEIFESLLETIRICKYQNIAAFNKAVSDKSNTSTKFFLRDSFWASSLDSNTKPFLRHVDCEVVGIRDLIDEFDPEVVICDVEGEELKILRDVGQSKIRDVVVEIHNTDPNFSLPVAGFSERQRISIHSNSFVVWLSRD